MYRYYKMFIFVANFDIKHLICMIIVNGDNMTTEMQFVDKKKRQVGTNDEIIKVVNEKGLLNTTQIIISLMGIYYNLDVNDMRVLNIFCKEENKDKMHLMGVFCATYSLSFASFNRSFNNLYRKSILTSNQLRGGIVSIHPDFHFDFTNTENKHFIVIDVNPEITSKRINF